MLAAPASATAVSAGAVLCGCGVAAGFANAISLLARFVPLSSLTQVCPHRADPHGNDHPAWEE